MTDLGLKDAMGPVGETVSVKVSVPKKPFKLVRVMVVDPVDP